MDNDFGITLGASLLAGLVTTGGIVCIRRYETWARHNTTYFACFAAGALIYVGATHLLPRAEREPRRFSLAALAAGNLVAHGVVIGKG